MNYNKILVLVGAIFFAFCKADHVTIYKYRIYCETEAQNVYTWREDAPTQCPNDTNHTINPESISIVDQMNSTEVSIKDEYVRTNKNFKTETRKISVAAGPDVETIAYLSWPFNISVLNLYFVTTADHQGDILQIEIPFDRVVGAITNFVATGTTYIPVTETVIENAFPGSWFYLDDGTHLDALGRVIEVDSINNRVIVETPTTHAFSPLTPTYTKITRRGVDFEIGLPNQYAVGMKTQKGAPVPANEPARIRYINKSSMTKDFIIIYEYLY